MTTGASGARRSEGSAPAPDVRGASRRFDEALAAARRAGDGAPARSGAPRPGGSSAAELRRTVEPPRRDPEAPGETAPGAVPAPPPEGFPAPAVTALRAAVRALPAVVEVARLREGAEVTLSLGGALGVDLRGGAGGVELTLRPDASLARAAAAELPGLVAALRARGVRVARAEVRSGPGARRSGGPALRAR